MKAQVAFPAALPDILQRIVARKKEELAQAKPSAELRKNWENLRPRPRGFLRSLTAQAPAIIAEIKQASPSRGRLTESFDPVRTAGKYEQAGAAALSVLTDRDFFEGSLDHLESARASVAVPVLRKDFTLDPYHVLEAAAHGADAILLIAAVLQKAELRSLRELAAGYGMDTLVEVHDEHQLESALESGAALIGVNNRNLHTFAVDPGISFRLAPYLPRGITAVSESGIENATMIQELHSAGYSAFLVGEYLMKAPDPGTALRSLLVTPCT